MSSIDMYRERLRRLVEYVMHDQLRNQLNESPSEGATGLIARHTHKLNTAVHRPRFAWLTRSTWALLFTVAPVLGMAPAISFGQAETPAASEKEAAPVNDAKVNPNRQVAISPLGVIHAGDWPHWRGPEMNGISRAKNLPVTWSPDGENVLWKNDELAGRSTPIVMNGKLYTLVRHKPATPEEAEKVICVDAATGKKVWENVFNVFESDVPDTRVGWSSVVGDPHTGKVFALGVCGLLQAIDAETGKTLWQRSMSEEYGMLTTYGGRTNFPIVFEHLVIIGGVLINWGENAQPAHRLMAFDQRNGELVWLVSTKLRPEDTTYSTPTFAVIDGEVQLVLGAGDGSMYGFQPRTGKQLWNYDVSPRGINTSPIVIGSTVICGHSDENLDDTKMGALFAIDATKRGNLTKAGELWRNKEQYIGKCAPVVVGDRIYAIDDGGIFFVVDLKTGKLIGKQKIGTMARASAVYGDGKIYAVDATGRWFTFEPDEAKGLKKVHSMRLDAEVNASPIIADGRLYVTTDTTMYCIGSANPEVTYEAIPPVAQEAPVGAEDQPAAATIVPAEAVMKPGQKLAFQVLLYNSKGQYLRPATEKEIAYTITGTGKIDPDGEFSLATDTANTASIVTAKIGEISTTARIRVIPDLPLEFAFSDGVVPITGIGMRYRHIGLDYDLWKKLYSENLLAAKCYVYLTTQFSNLGRDQLKIDDSTPVQPRTTFFRYLGLLEELTTQELAQAKLNPALELLQKEGVLASFKWVGIPETGATLVVAKGPRKVEGNGVLCKITTIPKGTRSQGWIGRPDMANYTIQADVASAPLEVSANADPNARMPDIGVMNQRYRIELMGASQQVKVYSWYPHDQKVHTVPYAWKPDTWYTMKMAVDAIEHNGQPASKVRGKVWLKDQPEPEAWTIEWIDQPANFHGSPGLFGNAKDTEIFFDNVKVTPRS
ncbi:outer membrane biogenesis protein BamB [Planctopirus ephydatiae]|uniref:Outer membrane biogenesis protein BamB n=1 Tax=Planctopirus ephydatiae TaxID=2528019 RepID=A0A518GT42_9PLAN|nr:PQQ-binding-like beta-propeller repeat protein [Planctopirus ephydatiae]QDV31754.1 outer membrane biogenesis protein BamB [Planctopirus ephydatiae]